MLCTSQPRHSAPPSPDAIREFSSIPDPRTHSPLTASSSSFTQRPITALHCFFPHSLSASVAIPTLPPLVEQDERSLSHSPTAQRKRHIRHSSSPSNQELLQQELEKVQQLQQEQQELNLQLRLQQETVKMDDVQLQQPLPPPIKIAEIPQPNNHNHNHNHAPTATTPREPTPTTPRPIATTPRSITSPRTGSPDPQPTPPRRGSITYDSPPPNITDAPPAENAPTTPVPKKETILLVEDNPINAKIASAVLRRHHFEVELAGNGQVALEKIKLTHGNFQLILMGILALCIFYFLLFFLC